MKTLLRLPEVVARTGMSRSCLYQAAAAGTFPKPVKLGPGARASAWVEDEVSEWVEARISERNDRAQPDNPQG